MNRTYSIYERFEQVSSKYSNHPAIIEDEGSVSFNELSDMADAIGQMLPEDVEAVGIMMAHGSLMIASILAVLKSGARYIPVEPTFPPKRIAHMMHEAQAQLIITQEAFLYRLGDLPALCITKQSIKNIKTSRTKNYVRRPEDIAYVLYTSGTSGSPKGVAVTNKNVCHYADAFYHEFHNTTEDIILQNSPCTFDIFVEEVFAGLLNGSAIAIPSDGDKDDIHRLIGFVVRHNVTIISGFPYLLAKINQLPSLPLCIRLLISGGDVLRGRYVDGLLSKTLVYNTYGPSETTVCATYYCCNKGSVLEDGTYPVGKPVKGAKVQILDEQGREMPVGEEGEICIQGDGVSNGYIGDLTDINKAFVRLSNGEMMYRSGDMGYLLPDGNIAFLHRKDTQVQIYGKRVEIREVEAVLYRIKGVEQVLVHAFKDEAGLPYICAYLVYNEKETNISAIKEELKLHLPDYMLPEYYIKLTHIPLNINGKPDIANIPIVLKD